MPNVEISRVELIDDWFRVLLVCETLQLQWRIDESFIEQAYLNDPKETGKMSFSHYNCDLVYDRNDKGKYILQGIEESLFKETRPSEL